MKERIQNTGDRIQKDDGLSTTSNLQQATRNGQLTMDDWLLAASCNRAYILISV